MSRHRFIPTAALVALTVALTLTVAGCASGGGDAGSGGGTATTAGGGDDGYGAGSPTTTGGGAGGGAGGSGEPTLTAQGFQWDQTTLSLAKDTKTLKVVNSDSALHSFTAEQINVDQDIEGGEDVDVTLDLSSVTGPVSFKCKYHSEMTGTIEVTG